MQPGYPCSQKTRVNPPIFKPVNPDLCAGKNPGLTGLNFGCQYCREQRGMDYSKFHDISDRFGYFFALGFVTGNIYGRLSATWQPDQPKYGRKERFGSSRGETGSRNMAATRFSDSATPTFDLSESRPKYTTTSGFANPLQV